MKETLLWLVWQICALMHMTAHNTLIMNSVKNLTTQKSLIGTEPFGGRKSPIRKYKKYNSKVVIGSMFYCCYGTEVVQWKPLLI